MKLYFKLTKRRYVVMGIVVAMLLISLGVYLQSVSAATVNLVPSSTVNNAWPGGTAGCTTTTTGHTCIDEGSTVNTADYVGTGTSVAAVAANFEMGNQANVATATQLTLYMYAWSASIGGGTADTVTMNATVGGASLGASSAISMTGTGTWYSITYNGTWTQAQVDNMQVSFSRTVLGSGSGGTRDDDVRIASVYVAMTYTSPVNISQAAYRWLADDGGNVSSGVFGSSRDYAISGDATDIAAKDFNADGSSDIAGISAASSNLSILLSNSNSGFDTKVDYATAANPSSVAAGDFNNDQIADLVVSYNTTSISVYIGNGNGTFAPKVDYVTGGSPKKIEVRDLNEDGKDDLVFVNSSAAISVLLGNGNGTFAPKVDYLTAAIPSSITTNDFNSDTNIDLAVINDSNISLFMNNGDGTFAPRVDIVAGSGPTSIVNGRLNTDQMADLAVINDSNISLFMNNGDGTFASRVDIATGTSPRSLALADLNGDTNADLVTANATDGAAVFIGNGNGTFAPKVVYVTNIYAQKVLTSDLNGDQIIDFFSMDNTNASINVNLGMMNPPQTALAAKDTPAKALSPGVGLRLRMNVAVTGGNMAQSTNFKLKYQQKSGTCSTSPASYSDVTSSSPVRFYDKTLAANSSDYSPSALDPSRSGVPTVGQIYSEKNPFAAVSSVPSGNDALWDISLTVDAGLAPQTTYCLMLAKSDNTALDSYATIPEIIIPSPTLEQSSYRFYQNANSNTPGSPLAAQNANPAVTVGSAFRLRQLLRQTNDSTSIGTSFKLQAAEKITSCSVGAYTTLSAIPSPSSDTSTGFQQTAASVVPATGSAGAWVAPFNAVTEDGLGAQFYFTGRPVSSTPITASQFGFNIPDGATIKGIEFKYKVISSAEVGEHDVYLVKNGSTPVGADTASLTMYTNNTAYTKGAANSLWGTTWTPAEINSAGFGVQYTAWVWADGGAEPPALSIDYFSLNVHYLAPATVSSFADNIAVANGATIVAAANDPSPVSGSVIPQTYNENETFTVGSTIQNGDNGMWDFALRADESLVGKTYCFRVVKSDNGLLANYAHYPEVTFVASGPTLSQQLRGGQSVVNGIKRPFNW